MTDSLSHPSSSETPTSPYHPSLDVDYPSCKMMSVRDSRNRKRRKSSSILILSILLILVEAATLTVGQSPSAAANGVGSCPSKCSCIWRNGKQTTSCIGQGMIAIPSGITQQTQVLNLNENNFQTLPSRVFQERGLTNLQKVFLSRCKLGDIRTDALVQLTNLVELDLSFNLLTHVPAKAFEATSALRRLVMSNNPISTVTKDSFTYTPNLNFLDLSDCQIDSIEAGSFKGLPNLQYLSLNGNRLSTLSSLVTQDLPVLYALDLHKNPWNCDCLLRPAREWMLRYNVPQSIPPTCSGPEKLSGMMWNSLELDEFACSPVILSRETDYTATIGSNVSIQCITRAQPEARVSWSIRDYTTNNWTSGPMNKNDRYSFSEDRSQSGLGIVSAILNISMVEESDGFKSFLCSAENSAGVSSKPFSLSVLSISGSGMVGSWSRVELSLAIVMSLGILIVLFVGIALYIVRSRRFKDNNSSTGSTSKANHPIVCDSSSASHKSTISGSMPQIDVLKNVPSTKDILDVNGHQMVSSNGFNNIIHPAHHPHHVQHFGSTAQLVDPGQGMYHHHLHHHQAHELLPGHHQQMMPSTYPSHVDFGTIDPVTGYPLPGHHHHHLHQMQSTVSVLNGDHHHQSIMYHPSANLNGQVMSMASGSTSSNNSINNGGPGQVMEPMPISGTCVICDEAFPDLRFHYMDYHEIRECIV